jgi:hypothetical protein
VLAGIGEGWYFCFVAHAARKPRPVEEPASTRRQVDPILEALERAPMGPADPPEVRAAMREGKELGRFVRGTEVSKEIQRRRAEWTKAGK